MLNDSRFLVGLLACILIFCPFNLFHNSSSASLYKYSILWGICQ